MDLLDVSVISAKGYKYILVVCDYFTKYTEAYPLKDKTARSVADALMDIWLPRYGFPLFLHSDQGKEFDNAMIHKLSELLGTVKTKTAQRWFGGALQQDSAGYVSHVCLSGT